MFKVTVELTNDGRYKVSRPNGWILCPTKNDAGKWKWIGKANGIGLHGDPIHLPKVWPGKYELAVKLWADSKVVCPCCRGIAPGRRKLSSDPGVRRRLEQLRKKYGRASS